jgi:predicted transcriptional regulator
MNKSIKVESFEQMRKRKLARARRLDQRVRIEPEAHITFERVEDLVACLTPLRLRIIETARRKALSVSELADVLERNRTAVQRDLKVLTRCGLVEMTRRSNPGHGVVQIVQAVAGRFTVTAQV